jgi:predicted nucleic acid-binding protein
VIVVDASAFLALLLRHPAHETIEDRMFVEGQTVHAPHLVDLEIAQVIRRYVARREIDLARGELAMADFEDMPLSRYPHTALLPRIWSLRDNLTAYDAAYVALAEALDAPLLTRDRRLGAASGHRAKVEVV